MLACLLLSAASPLFVRDRLLHNERLTIGGRSASLLDMHLSTSDAIPTTPTMQSTICSTTARSTSLSNSSRADPAEGCTATLFQMNQATYAQQSWRVYGRLNRLPTMSDNWTSCSRA
jgi:hypothetical protein